MMERYKLVLVGEPGVGKTSLHKRFKGKQFEQRYIQTLGVEFSVISREGKQIQIWDLAGQKGFSEIRKNYYAGTNMVVFVFQLDNIKTIESFCQWMKEAGEFIEESFTVIVVGNKLDLVDSKERKIREERVRKIIGRCYPYIETSAKQGKHIEDVLSYVGST